MCRRIVHSMMFSLAGECGTYSLVKLVALFLILYSLMSL